MIDLPTKPLPDWVKGTLPTQGMADLLRASRHAAVEADERLAAADRRALTLAETFALALWKKRADAKELRILFDALTSAGVEYVDHLGEEIDAELEEMADIIDWVDAAEGIEPGCVAEAFEPEVRLNGVLAHRAKLIGVLDLDDSEQQAQFARTEEIAGSRGFVSKNTTRRRQR